MNLLFVSLSDLHFGEEDSLLRDRLLSDMPLEELKRLPRRDRLAELETENWPWIDCFWSGFSRADRFVTLYLRRELEELAGAVAEAVKVRRKHFRKRVKRTSKLLKNLET